MLFEIIDQGLFRGEEGAAKLVQGHFVAVILVQVIDRSGDEGREFFPFRVMRRDPFFDLGKKKHKIGKLRVLDLGVVRVGRGNVRFLSKDGQKLVSLRLGQFDDRKGDGGEKVTLEFVQAARRNVNIDAAKGAAFGLMHGVGRDDQKDGRFDGAQRIVEKETALPLEKKLDFEIGVRVQLRHRQIVRIGQFFDLQQLIHIFILPLPRAFVKSGRAKEFIINM